MYLFFIQLSKGYATWHQNCGGLWHSEHFPAQVLKECGQSGLSSCLASAWSTSQHKLSNEYQEINNFINKKNISKYCFLKSWNSIVGCRLLKYMFCKSYYNVGLIGGKLTPRRWLSNRNSRGGKYFRIIAMIPIVCINVCIF